MTNPIALFLACLILVAVGVDIFLFDTASIIFLSKKLLVLIEWIAFWR